MHQNFCWLFTQTDANSDFEREVLQEIYQRGYKLPDTAQELITEANCKPDFVYKRVFEKLWLMYQIFFTPP